MFVKKRKGKKVAFFLRKTETAAIFFNFLFLQTTEYRVENYFTHSEITSRDKITIGRITEFQQDLNISRRS